MKTQYCKINQDGCYIITEQEAFTNTQDNIYFLDGVKDDVITRAKDLDIEKKDYFVIDIDFRNNCDYEISNDDIINELQNISNFLKDEHEYFAEWEKIVFSGNGGHIYFRGDLQEFEPEEYSLGVKRIFREWDRFWGAKEYMSDKMCCNLARILRLVGSINQKNGAKVKVIAEQKVKSRLVNLIKSFAKKEKQEIEIEKERRKKEIEEHLKTFKGDENKFYEIINSIPAYQIAELLLPQFSYNSKGNFKNGKKGFTGYYYIAETNTICNGGSKHFNWGNEKSCWNNFSIIKNFKNWDNRQVFDFYKQLLK